MKLFSATIVGVPLGLFVLGATSIERVVDTPCVVAKRWVESRNGALPSDLKSFSLHTTSYRKAIYRALPREVQLKLWHEQFAYYRTAESLSPVQRAFVAEVESAIDEYFGPDRIHEFDRLYKARAVEILGKPLARQVFADLGINTPEDLASVVVVPAGKLATCECATDSNWCDRGTNPDVCCVRGGSCETSSSGCGTLWCHSCNGTCLRADPSTGSCPAT